MSGLFPLTFSNCLSVFPTVSRRDLSGLALGEDWQGEEVKTWSGFCGVSLIPCSPKWQRHRTSLETPLLWLLLRIRRVEGWHFLVKRFSKICRMASIHPPYLSLEVSYTKSLFLRSRFCFQTIRILCLGKSKVFTKTLRYFTHTHTHTHTHIHTHTRMHKHGLTPMGWKIPKLQWLLGWSCCVWSSLFRVNPLCSAGNAYKAPFPIYILSHQKRINSPLFPSLKEVDVDSDSPGTW